MKNERTEYTRRSRTVIVFGATGRSGSAIVRRLLERGHQVTAFVRDRAKVVESHPNLRVVEGDVLSPDSVTGAIDGHDAVISALGAGRKGRIRSEGTRNIIRAMERIGTARLISQSSLGVGDSRGNLNAFWKHIMFGLLLRTAYEDHGVQERYVRESNLDWTIVRPGALVDGEATGDYCHGFSPSERAISLTVSLADLADFVVHELENGAYVHATPGVSYRRAE